MRNLRNKLDSAIVLITHDMGVVADLADRIAVMRKGLIVETGTAAQIFHNPQHEYTQALLAAVPHLGQGGAEPSADVDVTAALAAATHAEILSIPEDELIRRERRERRRPGRGRGGQAEGRTGPGAHRCRHRVPEAGPACRPSAPWKAPTWSSTRDRWSAWSASPAPARPPSAGPPSACCRWRPAPCGSSGRTFPPPRRTAGSCARCAGTSAWCSRTRRSSLNPRLPIGESIGEPMFLARVAKGAELQHRIEALLDQVELPRDYRNRYPHELSGGQKQRVGIARALSLKPKLMVADEPTSALDVSVQAKVLDLFQNLQKELGFACLFVTHDLAVVDVLADRICVMQRGRIVEQGTRDQILRNPQEPYTQRLLAAVPLPDPDKQRERRELRAQLLSGAS